MRYIIGVALAAALSFAASAASAADYLIYNFTIQGNFYRITNDPIPPSPYYAYGYSVNGTGNIIYYVPTAFANPGKSSVDIPLPYYITPSEGINYDRVIGTTTSNKISINEVFTSNVYRASSRFVTLGACVDEVAIGKDLTVDPRCSAVSFRDSRSLGFRGGDVREIGGTVTGLTITEGFGSVNYGLASYTIFDLNALLPEPRTWGMMILGFGIVGGVLRRRSGAARREAIAG